MNSGVVEKTTDDELACVIGHEIGHIAARHIAKKIQAQIGYDLLMNIALKKVGIGEFQEVVSIGYNLIMLGYSREDELMADRLGARYAYRAGYDPYALISFLKKIQSSKEDELGFVFLRSHPYTSQRIKMLEMQIPGIIEKENKNLPQEGSRILNISTDSQNSEQDTTSRETKINLNERRPLRVMCPVCKRIYPGTVRYCPYDGTELK